MGHPPQEKHKAVHDCPVPVDFVHDLQGLADGQALHTNTQRKVAEAGQGWEEEAGGEGGAGVGAGAGVRQKGAV